ncbi:MAG: methyltransferase domain-containing protein [Beijerinckiaceae bacterium]
MSQVFQSSGDLIADRRFEYAKAAAAEGDPAAAQDLLLQTIEVAPDWPAAWFALGDARLALDDIEGAREAFDRCRALDPADEQGAAIALAALESGNSGQGLEMSVGYVRNLFDQYAERFDSHLTKHLAYRGPELIRDAIARACAIEGVRPPFARALDIGCGTGLLGEQLQDMAKAIEGIDLSPRMIRMAKKRDCYDRLSTGDMLAFLREGDAGRYDLIAAADVFVYVGDLGPVVSAAARALKPRGLFAFSIQRGDAADYALGRDRRFFHRPAYVEAVLKSCGFNVVRNEANSTRIENGAPVPGAIFVAIKRR